MRRHEIQEIRVVVDTNIIISGLLTSNTPPACILDGVRDGKLKLLVSDAVVEEYLRVLDYPHIRKYKHITDETISHISALFIHAAERIEIFHHATASPDPDDNKFLSLAADGKADCIITGDKADLLALTSFQDIPILTARQAIERYQLS